MNKKNIFKNFGPAFLILALGIGAGELIFWPFLTVNYGLGILWGAILGITLQLILINIISRNTIIFRQNIILSFAKVFSWAFLWIIFSSILGFGWPGFSSLSAELLIDGFGFEKTFFLPTAIFILILSGTILILSKNAYKKILFLEKIIMSILLFLILFLFYFYFDLKIFLEMILGFLGIGTNYFFIPHNIEVPIFLATFLGAVAYAGSGGNLLLLNSFYIMKENEKENKNNFKHKEMFISIKNIFKQNLIFFWTGGIIIISMLSYISYAVLRNTGKLKEDFSFLILESQIFSQDISPVIGYLFIFLGAAALFGVQLGILDFLGRIMIDFKKNSLKLKEKISDKQAYSCTIIFTIIFGLMIFLFGIEQPKSLIVIGAVINAFSMGIIALLLLLLELKIIPKKFKSKKIIITLFLTFIFYSSFFLYVIIKNFL